MKKTKKITFLISSLSRGGAENVCVSIANIFIQYNWQVDLIILNLHNETYLSRLSKKVNLVVLNVNHARNSMFSLLKYVYKNDIKKIFIFNYELTVVMVILKIIFKIQIKIISRNINTFSIKMKEFDKQGFWTKYIVKILIKNLYTKVDYVINQCKGMHYDLINYYPKFNKKSKIIYNPLSPHIKNFLNTIDLTKVKKENYILCVGRLEEQKAFHYAIEAFAGIHDNFPELRLKVIGNGSCEKNLKQKAIECGVRNQVDFEGFQNDIISYYLHAKATVLTSLYEGYPNVLVESIALNTPVVAFNCPYGPSEIIQDGINGFLVNHKDTNDLKKKLTTLLLKNFNFNDLTNSIKNNQTKTVYKNYEKLIDSLV